MTPRSTTDPGATSFGWRVANFLATASPYLVAAGLFLALFLTRPPASPRSSVIAPPPPPPPANGTSVTADASPITDSAPISEPARLPARAQRAPSRPAPAETPPPPGQPVPVNPVIAGTMKLFGGPPVYPPIARAAGVQGIVVVDVIIGPTGFVQNARVLSGPPLLQAATIDALRAWHYRPWLVLGKPVPFETQVSIDFKINAAH